MVPESRPPETLATSGAEVPDHADVPAVVAEVHAPSVHDALLETVSAEALEAGTGQHGSEAPSAQPPADADETPDTVEAAEPAEPAPVMQPPEALDAAPDAVAVPDVTPEPEAVPVAETMPEPVSVPVIGTVAATVAPSVAAPPQPTAASIDVIGEITEANATILAFLRSEGSAAVAHWQSLSGAKTPADAIRIQVDEMQRAADASLTCFSVLARRAGRLAAGMGRA